MEEGKAALLNSEDVPVVESHSDPAIIFADAIKGAMVANGVAKLNLVQVRINPLSDTLAHYHVGTIVLPQEQLAAWSELFGKMANDLEYKEQPVEDVDTNGAP